MMFDDEKAREKCLRFFSIDLSSSSLSLEESERFRSKRNWLERTSECSGRHFRDDPGLTGSRIIHLT